MHVTHNEHCNQNDPVGYHFVLMAFVQHDLHGADDDVGS